MPYIKVHRAWSRIATGICQFDDVGPVGRTGMSWDVNGVDIEGIKPIIILFREITLNNTSFLTPLRELRPLPNEAEEGNDEVN